MLEMIDNGPDPYVVNIEKVTKENENYRTTLWTGDHLQMTLMSIQPGGDIGLEVHEDTDQFLRIEDGSAIVYMGPTKDELKSWQASTDDGVFVPAGTWHNLTCDGDKTLKVYSIYAPSHHPHGTIHITKADAEEAEAKE